MSLPQEGISVIASSKTKESIIFLSSVTRSKRVYHSVVIFLSSFSMMKSFMSVPIPVPITMVMIMMMLAATRSNGLVDAAVARTRAVANDIVSMSSASTLPDEMVPEEANRRRLDDYPRQYVLWK